MQATTRDIKSDVNRLHSATTASTHGFKSGNRTDQVLEYAVHGENTPVPSGITESCTLPTYINFVFEPGPMNQAPRATHCSEVHSPVQGSVINSAIDKTLPGENSL